MWGHRSRPLRAADGGFTASSPFPSADELARLVHDGALRFVLLVPMPGLTGPAHERAAWVTGHCRLVDPSTYGSRPGFLHLYDCSHAAGSRPDPDGG